MNLTPQSPFSSKASQLLSWGHWFTFANIGLVLLISISFLLADNAPTSGLGWFYMLVTWLSHTSFITFCAFVLTIFPLSLVFPYPRHIRGMAAAIATFGVSTLCLDAFVYYNLGYHINLQALPEIISLLWGTLTSSPAMTTVLAGSIIIIVLAIELIASNYAWRHLQELKGLCFPRYATGVIVACFAMSHIIHIWADANAYFDITKQDNVLPLSYPSTAKTLLARHDLLDIEEYKQARSLDLEGVHGQFISPTNLPACNADAEPVDILVFESNEKLEQFVASRDDLNTIEQLIQPTKHQDALFNLVYGLPAYYNDNKLTQALPAWAKSDELLSLSGFEQLNFAAPKEPALINIKQVNEQVGDDNNRLVIAFAMAPMGSKDLLYTSNLYASQQLNIKNIDGFKQLNDITYSLLTSHLKCRTLADESLLGRDLTSSHIQEGVNYTQGVLVAFKKDRITLINPDGSYKQVSGAEGFVIEQKLDIPFLIHSIKRLQTFTVAPAQG